VRWNQAQPFSLVAQAIRENNAEVRQVLDQLGARPDAPPQFKALIARLQAVLDGDRNPDLAADPDLDFWSSAELQLLLESLLQDRDGPKGRDSSAQANGLGKG
jgi:hypothetical protein